MRKNSSKRLALRVRRFNEVEPDWDNMKFKKLVEYHSTLLKECGRRSSICLCANENFDGGLSCRFGLYSVPVHAKEEWYKTECHKLHQLIRQDYLDRNPYLGWTKEVLQQCLEQRNIKIPEENSTQETYAEILQQADGSRKFNFMALPSEIRLHIYDMALLVNGEKTGYEYGRKGMVKPPLLQTCRQIRTEAETTFYRINRFFLHAATDHDPQLSTKILEWTKFVGSQVSNLRLITLNVNDDWVSPITYIHIDVCSQDPWSWKLYTTIEHTLGCVCNDTFENTRKLISYAEYAKRWPRRGLGNDAELERECIAVIQRAITELRAICQTGGYIQTSMAGLEVLIRGVLDLKRCMGCL